jgi:hypothetical protein
MMPWTPWVDVLHTDIADRFRPLTDDETVTVDAYIRDAQVTLESQAVRAGITRDGVLADVYGAETYKRIIATAVVRVLRNPDGFLEYTTDDFTGRYDKVISSGALYIGEDEVEQLRPVASKRRSGAFSIRPR